MVNFMTKQTNMKARLCPQSLVVQQAGWTASRNRPNQFRFSSEIIVALSDLSELMSLSDSLSSLSSNNFSTSSPLIRFLAIVMQKTQQQQPSADLFIGLCNHPC